MSWVESATLRLIDQASKNADKINASMVRLYSNTAKLNGLRVDLRIQAPGAQQTISQLAQLQKLMGSSSSSSGIVRSLNNLNKVNVNPAIGQLRQLAGAMNQTANAQSRLGIGLNLGNTVGQVSQLTRALSQLYTAQNRANGGGGGAGGSRFSNWTGRPGFGPNSSLQDRVQNRAVNRVERAIPEGALGVDKARTYLSLLGMSKDQLAAGEKYAASSKYKEMTRGEILQLFGEISTNYKDPKDALSMMPALQEVVRAGILSGENSKKAQDGLIQLVRGLGTLSKLTNDAGGVKMAMKPDGAGGQVPVTDEKGRHLSEAELALETYKRAKIIGGQDITPREFSLFAKYSRTAGQTISNDALLLSMLSMPDMRGSSYGNSLDQMVKQLTGRSTKEAQAVQAQAGLIQGGMERSTPGGPQKFMRKSTTDEEMLRSNPQMWFYKNIMGMGLEPGKKSYLEQQGIDVSKETDPAKVATVLGKIFSRATAEQLGNMIVNQRGELLTMRDKAKSLDVSPERLAALTDGSLNMKLEQAGQTLTSTIGDISEKLKTFLLPSLDTFGSVLDKIGKKIDPGDGTGASPGAVAGVVAGTAAGAGYLAYRSWLMLRGRGGDGSFPGGPGGWGGRSVPPVPPGAPRGFGITPGGTSVPNAGGPPGSAAPNPLWKWLNRAGFAIAGYSIASSAYGYDTSKPYNDPGNTESLKGIGKGAFDIGLMIAAPWGLVLKEAGDAFGKAAATSIGSWFDKQRKDGEVSTLTGPKPDTTVRDQARVMGDDVDEFGQPKRASDAARRRATLAGLGGSTQGFEQLWERVQAFPFGNTPGGNGPVDHGASLQQGAEAVRAAGNDAGAAVQGGAGYLAGALRDALTDGGSSAAAAIRDALSTGVNINVNSAPGAPKAAPTGVQQPSAQ